MVKLQVKSNTYTLNGQARLDRNRSLGYLTKEPVPTKPPQTPGNTALATVSAGTAVRDFAGATQAASTKKAYRSDWKDFEAWCRSRNAIALPAGVETVVFYLSDLATRGFKISTLKRRLATIAVAHRAKGFKKTPKDAFAVQQILKGIRRTVGAQPKQAKPLLPDDLRKIVRALPATRTGIRDRALLLFGFMTSFRGAEILSLDVEDLVFNEDGIAVTLRKSKTDQERVGRTIGVPRSEDPAFCPVRALRSWLDLAAIKTGPLFPGRERKRLHPHSLWLVVKATCRRAGIDPSGYSAHSLRAGFITAALTAGRDPHEVTQQTGHKSLDMLSRYYRPQDLFKNNAAKGLL